MKGYHFLIAIVFLISCNPIFAQENDHQAEHTLKRHKIGLFTGNSLIHGVHNTHTGKEQYVLAPTFGLNYDYWFSHKWAIGTHNEFSFMNIEVEHNEEEYLVRENAMLFSGVLLYEVFPRFGIFAGSGFETDSHHTLWVRYFGMEYSFIQDNNWDISVEAGYVNKEYYDAFSFGLVIGRRFGKDIPSKHH